MAKKIALDWDESELRFVAAQCSGSSVRVTDADVIPLDGRNVREVLQHAVENRGWGKAEAVVAIGRGQVELRELKLPVVPDDELPDMVRFQAIRSFASAGDSAAVDYLVTRRDESSIAMIAAALSPAKRNEIQSTCEKSGLTATRITLRPLCSAALYFIYNRQSDGEIVLIDLLADEAEIVIARNGDVVFLRTVKLPTETTSRARSLAGELRRSLIASGSTAESRRVILWGKSSVHTDDVAQLSTAAGSQVETLDPFSLVDVDHSTAKELPNHTGRLAPLVGLLAADELHADRLVDFLQPRKRPEPKSNRGKIAAMIGVPVAACLLLGFGVYRQFQSLDQEIEILQTANEDLKPQLDAADASLANVESVDLFLDSNVNWLNELKRVAEKIPASDKLIVRKLSGTSDPRRGGGTLVLDGGVTDSAIIQELEVGLRDDLHAVEGDGTREGPEGLYRYIYREKVSVGAASVRNARYEAYTNLPANPPAADDVATDDAASDDAASEKEDTTPTDEVPETDKPTNEASPSPPDPSPEADGSPSVQDEIQQTSVQPTLQSSNANVSNANVSNANVEVQS